MGEAKRRLAALDAGTPWPRRRVCPRKDCRSTRVADISAGHELALQYAEFWGNRNPATLRVCRDCHAIWEPWPDDASEDCVERARTHGPCDNCAYRKGSRELADPEERERLLLLARNAAEHGFEWGGMFCCHKGIPIRFNTGEGLSFDYEAAGRDPRMQACTGFLLALWAAQKRIRRRTQP